MTHKTTKADKALMNKELFYIVDENVTGTTTTESNTESPHKTKARNSL